MRLYQFALPNESNDGVSYAKERDQWEHTALALAGGFTTLGLHAGAWQDTSTGRIYREGVHIYQVACEEPTKINLVQRLNALFRDQTTFYVAEIGTAEIIYSSAPEYRHTIAGEEPDPITDAGARAGSEEPVDYAADMKKVVETALHQEASAEAYQFEAADAYSATNWHTVF